MSNPASYFEASFNADAGRAYHVWVRMKADGDSLSNDSVHLQFNDSLTSTSAPTARIGTDTSFEMVLQNGSTGRAPDDWGWTDNGWGDRRSRVEVLANRVQFLDGPRRDEVVDPTPDAA